MKKIFYLLMLFCLFNYSCSYLCPCEKETVPVLLDDGLVINAVVPKECKQRHLKGDKVQVYPFTKPSEVYPEYWELTGLPLDTNTISEGSRKLYRYGIVME